MSVEFNSNNKISIALKEHIRQTNLKKLQNEVSSLSQRIPRLENISSKVALMALLSGVATVIIFAGMAATPGGIHSAAAYLGISTTVLTTALLITALVFRDLLRSANEDYDEIIQLLDKINEPKKDEQVASAQAHRGEEHEQEIREKRVIDNKRVDTERKQNAHEEEQENQYKKQFRNFTQPIPADVRANW
jgi:hypothetical protein